MKGNTPATKSDQVRPIVKESTETWHAWGLQHGAKSPATGANKPMKPNLEKVKLLTRDLRNGKEYPRSPRETLGGYVLAARAVDKCRAVLAGRQGEITPIVPWISGG